MISSANLDSVWMKWMMFFLTENRIWKARTIDVGIISSEVGGGGGRGWGGGWGGGDCPSEFRLPSCQ